MCTIRKWGIGILITYALVVTIIGCNNSKLEDFTLISEVPTRTPVSITQQKPIFIVDVQPHEQEQIPKEQFISPSDYNGWVCVEINPIHLAEPGEDFLANPFLQSFEVNLSINDHEVEVSKVIEIATIQTKTIEGQKTTSGGPLTICWSAPRVAGIHNATLELSRSPKERFSYSWYYTIVE